MRLAAGTQEGRQSVRTGAAALALLLTATAPLPGATRPEARAHGAAQSLADRLRAIEHERLDALVRGDAATIARLTAEDYELVSPLGTIDRKPDELRGLPRGFYVALTPGPMAVRVAGPNAAILRYFIGAVLKVRGQIQPERHFWHTDYYERRRGQWQVVWSQSTEIPPPKPSPPVG